MSKAICIYPFDKTTAFLYPIYETLKEMGVITYYGNTFCQDFKDWLDAHIHEADTLFFLGHGSSYCLYGSRENNQTEFQELFSLKDFNDIPCKVLYLLSCKSNEFVLDIGVAHYVGFPVMPTSMDDLRELQDEEYNFHLNITEEDICKYNSTLVSAFCYAVRNSELQNTYKFYNEFLLYINKSIYYILTEHKLNSTSIPNPTRWDIVELLYDLKTGIVIQ